MPDLLQTRPEDDSGSDTFARYLYQAEVILPFCLHAALGDEILAVLPEHIEDVALQCLDRWRFIQIKSRNPELGLWKLSTLLEKRGALRSLYRTHLLTHDHTCSLELLLEGAPQPRDPIQELGLRGNRAESTLVQRVATRLGVDTTEAHQFLSRVTLAPPPSSRSDIHAVNGRLIHQHNTSLDLATVEFLHKSILFEIQRAMAATPIGARWPAYVVGARSAAGALAARISAKRLENTHLRSLLPLLTAPPRFLLRRLVDPADSPASLLEFKLIAGGADPELVANARILRANAARRVLELRQQQIPLLEEQIEDLWHRLSTYANAKRSLYVGKARPAPHIWEAILTALTQSAPTIDGNGLMQADPILLLGHVCDRSMVCEFDWGQSAS